MSRQLVRCSRCGRQQRMNRAVGWNATVQAGFVVGLLCDSCQTPEEHMEAIVNEAMLDYSTDAFGRVLGSAR